MDADAAYVPRPWSVRLGRWSSIAVELLLIGLGVTFIWTDYSDLTLFLWCVTGTLYTLVTVVVLSVSAVRRPLTEPPLSRHVGARIEYVVSIVSTLLASLVGIWAAVQLVLLRSGNDTVSQTVATGFGILGVWGMLLSWGLLHWGFAQAYRYLYYAREPRPLRFPATAMPKMVDFAYFSFGLGTSFAVSDVETLGSRIRWIVMWHSVVSFFFNGLIIVLALNIIMSAGH